MQNSEILRAIIIDDELHGRENLRKILNDYCRDVEVVEVADSVVNAIDIVKRHIPDVVFLDINMPVLDGFDFLQEFEERSFMVVFVSAHEEFGIKAVKAGAVDYLLKPINIKELKLTIKKLLALKSKKPDVVVEASIDKLVLPTTHGFEIIIIDEIIRIEAEGSYSKVVIKDAKHKIVSRTLKDFEDTLPKEKFFRTHKSHLINLKFIKDYSKIGGNLITMTDGSKVEISRRKAPEFVQRIKTVLNTV